MTLCPSESHFLYQSLFEIMRFLAGYFLIFFFWISNSCAQSIPELKFFNDPQSGINTLMVSGLEKGQILALEQLSLEGDQIQDFFPVYVGKKLPEEIENIPPVSGKYSFESDKIVFTPRFPFILNKNYFSQFHYGKFLQLINLTEDKISKEPLELVFMAKNPEEMKSPEILAVYPSKLEIPQNQLRLYVYFSKKMLTGHSHQYIKLYDESGQIQENAFLELDPELWDPSGKRLTVWFDPGRIKRDLKPNLQYGVPLEIGKTYTLEILSNFKDTQGNSLTKSFKKRFVVGEPDREMPNPEKWQLINPEPNSLKPLSILFPEPMDQALTSRMISVFDENGAVVEGTIALEKEETSWMFNPKEKWTSGKYQISIDTKLEDLAGNSLKRLFDEDNQNNIPSPYQDQDNLILKFEIPAF